MPRAKCAPLSYGAKEAGPGSSCQTQPAKRTQHSSPGELLPRFAVSTGGTPETHQTHREKWAFSPHCKGWVTQRRRGLGPALGPVIKLQSCNSGPQDGEAQALPGAAQWVIWGLHLILSSPLHLQRGVMGRAWLGVRLGFKSVLCYCLLCDATQVTHLIWPQSPWVKK